MRCLEACEASLTSVVGVPSKTKTSCEPRPWVGISTMESPRPVPSTRPVAQFIIMSAAEHLAGWTNSAPFSISHAELAWTLPYTRERGGIVTSQASVRAARPEILGIGFLILSAIHIPLPQADYHNIRHHDAPGEICLYHDHLLRWHPSGRFDRGRHRCCTGTGSSRWSSRGPAARRR